MLGDEQAGETSYESNSYKMYLMLSANITAYKSGFL